MCTRSCHPRLAPVPLPNSWRGTNANSNPTSPRKGVHHINTDRITSAPTPSKFHPDRIDSSRHGSVHASNRATPRRRGRRRRRRRRLLLLQLGRRDGVLLVDPPGGPRRAARVRDRCARALLPLPVVLRQRQVPGVHRRRQGLLGARPGAPHHGPDLRPHRPHRGAAEVERRVRRARHHGGRFLPRRAAGERPRPGVLRPEREHHRGLVSHGVGHLRARAAVREGPARRGAPPRGGGRGRRPHGARHLLRQLRPDGDRVQAPPGPRRGVAAVLGQVRAPDAAQRPGQEAAEDAAVADARREAFLFRKSQLGVP